MVFVVLLASGCGVFIGACLRHESGLILDTFFTTNLRSRTYPGEVATLGPALSGDDIPIGFGSGGAGG